jgi:aryl-alcohol dehydrogenase-like predicted oxidoreductase
MELEPFDVRAEHEKSKEVRAMQKRTLGRTGFEATVLGYGAMEIRGPRIWNGREVADGQAERILNAVLDAGINLIDTANDYGRSEAYIGRFISNRRDEY